MIATEKRPMKWAAYPQYKPSGVEWLGEIPAHWALRKLKHIAATCFSNVDKHTVEIEEPVRLCNYVDVYYNDYITPDLNFMEATARAEEIAKFKLGLGDVIITKDSEEWNDIAVPAFVARELDGVLCGYHLALIRPHRNVADGRYLFRSFTSRGINHQFRIAATGITRYGLGKYDLDNALFLVPPLPEQRAIAAFLDRETQRIDSLVAKKERQIELLQEKRAALISQAVTKGLDPNVPMKDSGVEWLGEIPANWLAHPVKQHYEVQLGKMLQNAPASPEDRAVPYIKALHVLWGRVNTNDLPEMWASPAEVQQYGIQGGDLLVCEGGEAGRAGIVDVPPPGCIIQNALHRVRAKDSADVRFLQHVLNTVNAAGWFDVLCNRATIAHFTREKLADLRMPVPRLEEQRIIAVFLDRETARIDALIGKIQASVEKLREYRSTLISAAVTGRIDVRAEAAAS